MQAKLPHGEPCKRHKRSWEIFFAVKNKNFNVHTSIGWSLFFLQAIKHHEPLPNVKQWFWGQSLQYAAESVLCWDRKQSKIVWNGTCKCALGTWVQSQFHKSWPAMPRRKISHHLSTWLLGLRLILTVVRRLNFSLDEQIIVCLLPHILVGFTCVQLRNIDLQTCQLDWFATCFEGPSIDWRFYGQC